MHYEFNLVISSAHRLRINNTSGLLPSHIVARCRERELIRAGAGTHTPRTSTTGADRSAHSARSARVTEVAEQASLA